jgi:CheY-like chemotaxis protein/HPt (histidine-containing phosphotransfer) domain-containing protein
MTQEVLGRVFSPFTQGEGTTTRRFGGTGLGLSICKGLVELMEGEIVCHSEPGRGTVFTIALRFGRNHWAPPEHRLLQVPLSRALVVCSDPLFRADAEACLGAMQVAHEAFVCSEDMARWLHTQMDQGNLDKAARLLLVTGPGNEDWRQIRRMAAAACERELPQVVWSPGQRQAFEQVDSTVVRLGWPVLSTRTLEEAIATTQGDQPAEAPPSAMAVDAFFVGESIRLLIAEDHEINQRVIQRQLHRLGIRGDIAADGEQALEAWRRGSYDAILADLHMPRMDGYQLARAIRREEASRGLSRIPIIAFTANAIIGEGSKCFEAGMDDVVTKPVELERLREALVKWLAVARPRDAGGPRYRGAAAEGNDGPSPHLDVRVLEQLVGEDPDVVADFLNEFGQTAARLMQVLRVSVSAGDWREARSAAHRLKSSARSVGARALGALSEDIETLSEKAGATEERMSALLTDVEEEWMLVSREIDLYMRLHH